MAFLWPIVTIFEWDRKKHFDDFGADFHSLKNVYLSFLYVLEGFFGVFFYALLRLQEDPRETSEKDRAVCGKKNKWTRFSEAIFWCLIYAASCQPTYIMMCFWNNLREGDQMGVLSYWKFLFYFLKYFCKKIGRAKVYKISGQPFMQGIEFFNIF
jgi:hypothetical protein